MRACFHSHSFLHVVCRKLMDLGSWRPRAGLLYGIALPSVHSTAIVRECGNEEGTKHNARAARAAAFLQVFVCMRNMT